MLLNDATGTIHFPRETAARLFCVTLTYFDDGCLCSGQDYRQRKPGCLIFHLTVTTTKQKPQILMPTLQLNTTNRSLRLTKIPARFSGG